MKKSTGSSTESKEFLIDTHIFIWWMEKSKRLPKNLYSVLNNPQNSIFLSVVSVWEIILKRKKGKVKTTLDLEKGIRKSGFIVLPIQLAHVIPIDKLPTYHSDPFDRLLITQAKIENLPLITADQKIWKYDIDVLKC